MITIHYYIDSDEWKITLNMRDRVEVVRYSGHEQGFIVLMSMLINYTKGK